MTEPSPLLVRDLAASDRPALLWIFAHLSQQSRTQRFLVPKRELTPADLDGLTAVDQWHHAALIAFSPVPREPIAVARYIRLTTDFDLAEIAVTVVDGWQHRGVGSLLVDALQARAEKAGVRRYAATLLHDNRGARALVHRLGTTRTVSSGGGVLELVAGPARQ